mmetsp:Transcript_17490/g.50048  ORF Transcript_17490/g.50048 Transcript_17490/m.50048 type:complete len:146 (+) Transcript_17490:44-481(+)
MSSDDADTPFQLVTGRRSKSKHRTTTPSTKHHTFPGKPVSPLDGKPPPSHTETDRSSVSGHPAKDKTEHFHSSVHSSGMNDRGTTSARAHTNRVTSSPAALAFRSGDPRPGNHSNVTARMQRTPSPDRSPRAGTVPSATLMAEVD